jgi:CRP-like cAMP-binding protein
MTPAHGASTNLLIAALPDPERPRWLLQLESVELPAGRVLHECASRVQHVYFPTTAIATLRTRTEAGASAEIAVVGKEGLVGVSTLLGGDSSADEAVVQCAGQGFRLPAALVQAEFHRSASIRHLLLLYTQALLTQMAQTTVCNRLHSLDQRLCRWMLMRLDRLPGEDIVVTQEAISEMLGVRREGVTLATAKLQREGYIRSARSRITVVDRPAIEEKSCECYAVVRREYLRLLPRQATV